MATLEVLRGVPASGKSTYALSRVEEGYVRVNRDDIRFTLFGAYWGEGVDENVVTEAENAMINAALAAGRDVVLDATNLNDKALRTKLSLASRHAANVVYVGFPVPLSLALEFNAGRDRQVPESAIRSFYKRYKINPDTGVLPTSPEPLPFFQPYRRNENCPPAYIVDTDGTVANHEPHRGPYDTSRYHLDTPIEHVTAVVNALANEFDVIALSGRDASFREVTEDWWVNNDIFFHKFFMRPEGDKRMDAIVKYELFKEHIEPYYNVLGAFDDRPQVIRMWETIGVPVFMVGPRTEF